MIDFLELVYNKKTLIYLIKKIIKYLSLSGGAYLFFYVFFKKQTFKRKIQTRYPKLKKILHEIKYSILTIGVYSFFAVLYIYNDLHWGLGYKYDEISEFGVGYLILSVAFLFVWHDTYFYWTHRMLHHKSIYKYTHKVHHVSINPTPLASYSFHPIEAIISFGFIPIAMAVIPFYKYVFPLFLLADFLHNIISHLGHEYYPNFFIDTKIGRIFSTSTFHNGHHKMFTKNFSLYFTFWDRLMGTIDTDYEHKFKQIKNKK